MAQGTVEDVLIAVPAPRATDAKSTSNALTSLSLTVKQNGSVQRQHRQAWLDVADNVEQPTTAVPAFVITPSAGYVQAEATAAVTQLQTLAAAIRVLQAKVDAIAKAADDNIVQVAEA